MRKVLKNVIYDSFFFKFRKSPTENSFSASDGASVNSGMKLGLIALLKEDYE